MGKEYLDRRGLKDLSRPFPLLRELFEYAESQGFSADNWSEYGAGGEHHGEEHKRAIDLPERFSSLVQEYPGHYFIVAYANRQDPYFAEGTRERRIRLSTVKKSDQTDDRIREIDLTEMDPSKGNKMQMTVREKVNNQQFHEMSANLQTIDVPHGEAKATYEIDVQGKKENKSLYFSRLDQDTFPWKGEQKPIRWLRSLVMEKGSGKARMEYKDGYLIGLRPEGGCDEDAEVKVEFYGSIDEARSIRIEIGNPIGRGRYIYRDEVIAVVEHEPLLTNQNQMEILKNDTAYDFLFKRPVDHASVVAAIKAKVQMLQADWDKPQSVYSKPPVIGKEGKLLE